MPEPSVSPDRPSEKYLVYDGDCPMCVRAAGAFVRAGVFPAGSCRPAASFEGDLAARLLAAGIRNEMAIVDPTTGEIRTGVSGILWRLRDTRLAWIARAVDRPGVRSAVSGLYRLVSLNRRILATPAPRAIPCACEPDDVPGLRWVLAASLVGFAAAAAAAFGAVFLPEIGIRPRVGPALGMVALAGAGWALLIVASVALPRDRRGLYVAHLAATMAAGSAVLLPSILLGLFAAGLAPRALFALSVAVSFVLMLGMQRRRVAYLRLRRGWVAAWAAALLLGAAAATWLVLPA